MPRYAEQFLVSTLRIEVDNVLAPGSFGRRRPNVADDQADALVKPIEQRLVEVDPLVLAFAPLAKDTVFDALSSNSSLLLQSQPLKRAF